MTAAARGAALEAATDLLHREAAALDEQRWDDWLALYLPDCEYWVPTWRTEDALTEDPQRELSHIYYASRAGLEDRIVRIRSRRSPASMPLRRTAHLVSNILVLDAQPETIDARATWTTHVFDPHRKTQYVLFGWARYALAHAEGAWRIRRKRTILQSDYLPAMVDVYCL
jgi:3-phenylpropionate/cinnamic acid dioxygenase small subunit